VSCRRRQPRHVLPLVPLNGEPGRDKWCVCVCVCVCVFVCERERERPFHTRARTIPHEHALSLPSSYVPTRSHTTHTAFLPLAVPHARIPTHPRTIPHDLTRPHMEHLTSHTHTNTHTHTHESVECWATMYAYSRVVGAGSYIRRAASRTRPLTSVVAANVFGERHGSIRRGPYNGCG